MKRKAYIMAATMDNIPYHRYETYAKFTLQPKGYRARCKWLGEVLKYRERLLQYLTSQER